MNYNNELDIVWLEDPLQYRFLRELWVYSGTRTRQPVRKQDYYKLVGYSRLKPSVTSDSHNDFYRRVFYRMPHDDAVYVTSFPLEGYSTETLIAGQPGEKLYTSDHKKG